MPHSYTDYVALMQKLADLSNAIAVMSWDNGGYLPGGSGALSARQIATLATMTHELFTAKSTGSLLTSLQKEKLPFKKNKNIFNSFPNIFRLFSDVKLKFSNEKIRNQKEA